MSERARVAAGIGLVAVLVAIVVIVALRWSPTIPPNAADEPLTTTVLTGPIAPDEEDTVDVATIPRSPSGSECLDRIVGTGGFIDPCWQAYHYSADADPDKDYYLLEVFATFGPSSGRSPRWAILRADLRGQPADGVLFAWPDSEFDATCQPVPVKLELVDPGTDATLCGHIRAAAESGWVQSVTWTCEGCLLPDDRDRELELYVAVGVAAGTVPAWDISADVGD